MCDDLIFLSNNKKVIVLSWKVEYCSLPIVVDLTESPGELYKIHYIGVVSGWGCVPFDAVSLAPRSVPDILQVLCKHSAILVYEK